jgi:hypothetical protein
LPTRSLHNLLRHRHGNGRPSPARWRPARPRTSAARLTNLLRCSRSLHHVVGTV